MQLKRQTIATRALTGRCPNCGTFGLFKHWFRLKKSCSECGMQLEKEESGFYFGTTSIGYVLAILFVIIPVCILVILNLIGMWTGVVVGIAGSIFLCILLYPPFALLGHRQLLRPPAKRAACESESPTLTH